MPRSLPAAIPTNIRGKSKGNRSIRCIPGGNEAIWDEELHTALIEGVLFDRRVHKILITSQLLTFIHLWADNAYGLCMMAARATQAWVDVSLSSNI